MGAVRGRGSSPSAPLVVTRRERCNAARPGPTRRETGRAMASPVANGPRRAVRVKFVARRADGIDTMANLRFRLLACLPLLAVAACATMDTTLDLARNERLYVDVPFQSRAPGDRDLFVAPLADARSAKDLPLEDQGFPITYGTDGVWERPVRDMVDEVLARQLEGSGLFAAVSDRAGPSALVMTPSLVSFTTGAVEGVAGARSFAEVALRLRVFGPADKDGERTVVLDQTFADRKITEESFKPVSPYLLVGGALRAAVHKALTGLDGSNVGRSHMPAEAAVPAGR